MTIREAFVEFSKTFPDQSISESKFYKLRPKFITLSSNISRAAAFTVVISS